MADQRDYALEALKAFYYEEVFDTVKNFLEARGLNDGKNGVQADYFEWYQGEPEIVFGKNLSSKPYRGIRRQVSLRLELTNEVPYINVFAAAYNDSGKKLKVQCFVFEFGFIYQKEQFRFILRNALEIAWRVANSIKQREFVSHEEWIKSTGVPE